MPRNAALFIWYRLLFNSRFYYPVYTILFLDFGLTLTQFASLNVIWAVTIVLLEVPSGAMADVWGRRNLVVLSASLMVVEMLVFALLPVGGDWVYWIFVLNRVISGAAEAMGSGADEALAYDSIPAEEQTRLWPQIMARLARWSAVGFIISAPVGALVYDAEKVNGILSWLGWTVTLSKETTLKFPIYLCVLSSIACLAVTLAMKEAGERPKIQGGFREDLRQSWLGIRDAGAWVWRTPAPLLLLTLGFLLDSVVRLFYTVASNFYRLIGLQEASFGLISVAGSILAFSTSGWMSWLVRHRSAPFNFGLVVLMVAWGMAVLAHPMPGWWSVVLLAPLMLAMRFLHFFLSHYLNEVTASHRRATVLGFRGMTMNLAYGSVMMLFGWQTAYLAGRLELPNEDLHVFAQALTWWPWWFVATMAAYGLLRWMKLRGQSTLSD